MKDYFFHPAARAELLEEVAFYDERKEGLGSELLDEVEATIERIRFAPSAWPKLSPRVRRCLTRRFPYGVLYRELHDAIEIVAVMHLHRHPDAWKAR